MNKQKQPQPVEIQDDVLEDIYGGGSTVPDEKSPSPRTARIAPSPDWFSGFHDFSPTS